MFRNLFKVRSRNVPIVNNHCVYLNKYLLTIHVINAVKCSGGATVVCVASIDA